jgi:hypothetical protein
VMSRKLIFAERSSERSMALDAGSVAVVLVI